MKIYDSIIILLWLVIWPIHGTPSKKKSKTIQNFSGRTGEPIAVDHLIWEYEKEHQTLYNEECRDGNLLQWPYLDNKNLSNYCRKYLQHAVPRRTTDDATGTKIVIELHYVKENTRTTSIIVIIQCKIFLNRCKPRSYYMTRATKSNCVYALNKTKEKKLHYKYTIINKHCNFDDKPLINKRLKQKHVDIIRRTTDARTGQPIAKDEYLQQYELEHLDLIKKEGNKDKCIKWPHVITHENLNIYCYQYMRECCPRRNREGVTGIWQNEKLHYQKINTNLEIIVTTVKCVTYGQANLHYRMTRAPEKNCVYALLRKSGFSHDPMVIAFKHCDFEEPNDRQTTTENEKWVEIISRIHRQTGQPIAKDTYLLEHELEHREFLQREGDKDKIIEWPQAMIHGNLNSYCYQYMREVVPSRNREGITGRWKTNKLHYRKINTEDDIEVITVICKIHNVSRWYYYITRAPKPNCVYALLHHGRNIHAPLVIIFKHCDFEFPNNQ